MAANPQVIQVLPHFDFNDVSNYINTLTEQTESTMFNIGNKNENNSNNNINGSGDSNSNDNSSL